MAVPWWAILRGAIEAGKEGKEATKPRTQDIGYGYQAYGRPSWAKGIGPAAGGFWRGFGEGMSPGGMGGGGGGGIMGMGGMGGGGGGGQAAAASATGQGATSMPQAMPDTIPQGQPTGRATMTPGGAGGNGGGTMGGAGGDSRIAEIIKLLMQSYGK